MGKNRKSKRQLVRDEKRAKKREREIEHEEERDQKKQRRDEEAQQQEAGDYVPPPLDGTYDENAFPGGAPDEGRRGPNTNFEREFFGMLAEEEQEYFRHADELLELNDFPSSEERDIFLQNVYKEMKGKELKLASSQSCSRLMERLILLSNTRQKKSLFDAFGGHFISLVTHRFASHCCEKLFLQSAPVVTQELSGEYEMEPLPEGEEEIEAMKSSMEDLFLLTLDELEEHIGFLLSDRFGSHAMRALLVILSGRPLDQAGTKSLLQSRKKEYITVEGAAANASELSSQVRAVPSSFTMAIKKIIDDSTATMDATALRVLAKHPTGNPTLQLLLELELTLFGKNKEKKEKKQKKGDEETEEKTEEEAQPEVTLLGMLVPDAPAAFADNTTQAAEFVNSMIYDPIGSRLLETLITHCPGKVFKGLQQHIFGPRIQSLLRNDIACYPAIRVLNRLSREDLADAVEKSLPEMANFVDKGRFNVIKTLFERCHVRNGTDEINSLLKALTSAYGNDWKNLVPKLCMLDEVVEEEEKAQDQDTEMAEGGEEEKKEEKKPEQRKFQTPEEKNKAQMLNHGSQLVAALLAIPGQPSKAIQASLAALKPSQIVKMATTSRNTSSILVKALQTTATTPTFHKVLVSSLLPHVWELATSQHGSTVLNEVIALPSKPAEPNAPAVPFHMKENIISQLAQYERDLRESWLGRNVWRTWKGDMWSHRRHDWVRWAKETDPETARVAAVPKKREEKEKEEAEKKPKGYLGKNFDPKKAKGGFPAAGNKDNKKFEKKKEVGA
ncbi:armadillo-type protein [Sordaria brevicollis]|uniref:Nucleolar protein 9 n=1 Tax=Sordaria brevicollis TaxID=83679 RepID=A0AAE0P1R3_SORBR|nr:armadillo-type protein [Sordaria brevicollis]